MINNQIYYNTVDKHRLHVADEASNYGGSINSYNNFISSFFARTFKKSLNVIFNGNICILNKKSYKKFLRNNGINASDKNIFKFTDFNKAMTGHHENWQFNGHMRDHLSLAKSHKMFVKLVYTIKNQNITKAKQLIGQGANIEKDFWEREDYGISFNEINYKLPEGTLTFIATQYNPILYAAKNNFADLVRFLIKVGSSQAYQGKTVSFTRSISHIEKRIVRQPFVHSGRNGNFRYLSQYQQQTIIHYRNSQKKLKDHYLDANFNFVTH